MRKNITHASSYVPAMQKAYAKAENDVLDLDKVGPGAWAMVRMGVRNEITDNVESFVFFLVPAAVKRVASFRDPWVR